MLSQPIIWDRKRTAELLERLVDVSVVMMNQASDPTLRAALTQMYCVLRGAKERTLQRIFRDPRTEIAIVEAERNLTAAGGIPSDAAPRWALQLGAMALGVGVLDRRDVSIELFSHPASDLVVSGTDLKVPHGTLASTQVLHWVQGELCTPSGAISMGRVPTFGGFQLAVGEPELRPPAFLEIVDDADGITDKWAALLERSGQAIAAHEPSKVLSECFGGVIVPVCSAREQVHSSVSFASRPGVLFMSWCPRASVIAEAIVHESDHQLFYVLCREAPLWMQPPEQQPALFRSPWRDDPRPLDGLLRGASAFIRVAEFWQALAADAGLVDETTDWASRRAVLAALQSAEALRVIGRHRQELMPVGCTVVESLDHRAQAVLGGLSRDGAYATWREWAEGEQRRHNAAWSQRHAQAEADQLVAL